MSERNLVRLSGDKVLEIRQGERLRYKGHGVDWYWSRTDSIHHNRTGAEMGTLEILHSGKKQTTRTQCVCGAWQPGQELEWLTVHHEHAHAAGATTPGADISAPVADDVPKPLSRADVAGMIESAQPEIVQVVGGAIRSELSAARSVLADTRETVRSIVEAHQRLGDLLRTVRLWESSDIMSFETWAAVTALQERLELTDAVHEVEGRVARLRERVVRRQAEVKAAQPKKLGAWPQWRPDGTVAVTIGPVEG